jgi:hypothetical protein
VAERLSLRYRAKHAYCLQAIGGLSDRIREWTSQPADKPQAGASSITIGSATNGSAVLQIGIPNTNGTLTTGTGTLTINKTGSLYVGDFTGTFTGTLNANGDIKVNGGQFLASNGFSWASGKTLTIENGSNVIFNGPVVIPTTVSG